MEIHKNNYINEMSSEKAQQELKNKFSPFSKSVKKHFSDKIYIDGSLDQKPKQLT